jgi:phenylacetate-CoA ligase
MLLSEWTRKAGFWTLDFLKGSHVRKHYYDIKRNMDNGSDPNITQIQADYLGSILKYATENVPFYRKFKAFDSLKTFPVVNKNIIRDSFEAFQSSQFLGVSVVDMHTSGSTGTPFLVRHDKNKRDRVYAEMMYFWGKAGYQIGMRYVFFRVSTLMDKRTAWARNVIMWSVQNLDEENFGNIRRKLKSDRKIRMLLGYPGDLNSLANYLLARGDSPEMYHIKTIIGYGESFPKRAHENLKKVFNSNVVSLYSNQENGMLAQEFVENSGFQVNTASYYIEILKMDSDDPAGNGEPGRIVVTDLFNHAMPMIRYDTGDVGIWKQAQECGWNSKLMLSIRGQKADPIYDTKGNKKSPYNISVIMWPFDKLLQYQFIQEDEKKYVLKLNGAEGYYEEASFVDLFKGLLGQDAEIAIEHVHEIPVLSSGKRKEIVCKYVKEET